MSALDSPLPTDGSVPLRGIVYGTLALLGCLWLILVNQLRLDWETNPQYSYGWLVPFLAAYLFWLRWPTRPEPRLLRGAPLLGLAAGLVALLLLPTRLIGEAAPEWSLVSWGLALEVVGLTLCTLAYAGGWPTLRHFAWPACFFLVAVAWPARLENALTQGLMQHLAAIASELLNWAGVPAVPQGNLISLSTGVVGVDEACSGVRSLQSMLMASLFLGEMNRFSLLGRFGVLLGGLGLALFFNVARAMILVTIAVSHGLPALEKWHDPAGFSILILSFIALYGIVRLVHPPALVEATGRAVSPLRPLPGRVLLAVGAWLLAVEGGTELWYRAHEDPALHRITWGVRWPEEKPGFKEVPIAPNVSTMLACTYGRQVSWGGPAEGQWHMFAFQWDGGRTSTLAARMHKPETCLPASGRKLVRQWPDITVPVGGVQIPFRTLEFENQGRPLFVFFCLWEVGVGVSDSGSYGQGYRRSNRLQRVLIGQRNLGQQSVEIVLDGPNSALDAIEAFKVQVGHMLQPI